MFLFDMGHICVSSMSVAAGYNDRGEARFKDILRSIILEKLYNYLTTFKRRRGEKVYLLWDAPRNSCWRLKVFEWYKWARRNRPRTPLSKTVSWAEGYEVLEEIKAEFEEYLMIYSLEVRGCEADDLMGWMVKKSQDEEPDERIIMGAIDKDFGQLLRSIKIRQYQHSAGKISEIKYDSTAEELLTKLILRGDSDDGVPNIFSPADNYLLLYTLEKEVDKMTTTRYPTNPEKRIKAWKDSMEKYEAGEITKSKVKKPVKVKVCSVDKKGRAIGLDEDGVKVFMSEVPTATPIVTEYLIDDWGSIPEIFKRNWKRNARLVDLSLTPGPICDRIMEEYEKLNIKGDRESILRYFDDHFPHSSLPFVYDTDVWDFNDIVNPDSIADDLSAMIGGYL